MAAVAEAAPAPATRVAVSRHWRVQRRHKGFFTGGKAALSPDEQTVFCWNAQSVTAVDRRSGTERQHLDSEQDGFSTFAVHPSRPELATACQSLLLKRWDLETGKTLQAFRGHNLPVLDMTYDASGTMLATGSADRSVRVWNAEKGFLTHNFRGHPGVVLKVVFHPTVRRLLLASACGDGEVRLWHLESKQCRVLANHMSAVLSLAFLVDGETLVSGGKDNVINFWSVESGKLLRTVPVFEAVTSLVALPSPLPHLPHLPRDYRAKSGAEPHVISGGDKGRIRVWNAKSFTCVAEQTLERAVQLEGAIAPSEAASTKKRAVGHTEEAPLPYTVTALLLAETRRPPKRARERVAEADAAEPPQLIAVTGDHNFMFLRLEDLRRFRLFAGFNDDIVDVRCLPDSKRAVVVTNSLHPRLFDLDTFDTELLVGHTDIVLAADVSPDGRWLVTGSKDNTLRFWSLAAHPPRAIAVCTGHTETVTAVRFAPLESAFRSASPAALPYAVSTSRDRTLKQWDLASLHAMGLAAEAGGAAEAKQVEIVTRANVLAHSKDVNCVAVAPNNSLVATGSLDRLVKVWSATDLSLVATLRGHRRGVWSVQFSPLDRVLASASGDKTIKLWSLTDSSCLMTLEGHLSSVLQVRFVNHATQLMTSSADGAIKLWLLKTQECVGTFGEEEHAGKVWALDVSRDGKTMVSGGSDSVLNVWADVTEAEALNAAKQEQEHAAKEQALLLAVRRSKYADAIKLAIDLQQPRRLRETIEGLMAHSARQRAARRTSGEAEEDLATLSQVLRELTADKLAIVLRLAREWNTNARHFAVAQRVLSALVRSLPFAELVRTLNKSGSAELVESLLAYSERHMQRIDRLVERSFVLDYVSRSMGAVAASGPGDAPLDSLAGESDGKGELGVDAASEERDGEDDDDEVLRGVSFVGEWEARARKARESAELTLDAVEDEDEDAAERALLAAAASRPDPFELARAMVVPAAGEGSVARLQDDGSGFATNWDQGSGKDSDGKKCAAAAEAKEVSKVTLKAKRVAQPKVAAVRQQKQPHSEAAADSSEEEEARVEEVLSAGAVTRKKSAPQGLDAPSKRARVGKR
jgi:U3 small nucleolar RNA-associated protein 13